ncbi:MAG TPA: helix-turn-helix domain-containing protein [Pseudogracilibacillus sp.]|nr:helix-turn-helix domain-containing protein [Pseudogracilibacillus sp.]
MRILKKLEQIYSLTKLQEVVEWLSSYFKRSIIIENAQFELVAYNTPNEFLFDPIQQKTILTKRCPLFVIERLKKEGIISRLENERLPIRMEAMEDIDFYQRIILSLVYKDQVIGYLWVYETEDSLTDEDLTILTSLATFISKLLYEKQNKEIASDSEIQAVLWKIINNEYINEAQLKNEAKVVNLALPERFTVIIGSVTDPLYLYLLDKIKQIFIKTNLSKIEYYLGKGTEIVGIVYGEKQTANNAFEKATALIEEVKLSLTDEEQEVFYIGVGNEYNHVNYMRTSYLEALEVVETSVFLNKQSVFAVNYRSLGIKRYLKEIYKKNIAENYYHPTLLKLIGKDLESKSELTKTLRVYLENDSRVGLTANELFIHTNTLNYRIKQMQELSELNLTNFNEKTNLYLELQLLNYLPEYVKRYEKKIKALKN